MKIHCRKPFFSASSILKSLSRVNHHDHDPLKFQVFAHCWMNKMDLWVHEGWRKGLIEYISYFSQLPTRDNNVRWHWERQKDSRVETKENLFDIKGHSHGRVRYSRMRIRNVAKSVRTRRIFSRKESSKDISAKAKKARERGGKGEGEITFK